jgi:CRP/FNR family transcriptional regulator, anaerobic regulatory protein
MYLLATRVPVLRADMASNMEAIMAKAPAPDTSVGALPIWAERRVPGLRTLLHGLAGDAHDQVLGLAVQHQQCASGETLYEAGTPVSMLYAVQSGAVKSVAGRDAHRRVVGYYVIGDLLGFAGLASGTHIDDAVACDVTDIAALPYIELARLARDLPELHRSLERLLVHASSRPRAQPDAGSCADASARLSHFLLQVGERYGTRGFPARCFRLHLSHAELGSFLALSLDVVDESFANLARSGWVECDGATVVLLDVAALHRAAATLRAPPWNPGKLTRH